MENSGKAVIGFQSTHPSRGATRFAVIASAAPEFQSTHPSRGATAKEFAANYLDIISIHAPLTGCDLLTIEQYLRILLISIHAPLTGCDHKFPGSRLSNINFNPRTPHGVRPVVSRAASTSLGFQSTHPSRGATMTPPRCSNYI